MIPTPGFRLAVVLSHPIQYYSPWFRWMAANTALDLRVFYLWDFGASVRRDPQFQAAFQWDVDLLSGYSSEFVPNASRDPGPHHFTGLRNPLLAARLDAWHPSALLLFGYKWMSHLGATAWARNRGIPVIFRGDSHLLGRPAPGPIRSLPLRFLFRRFAAFAYVGAANRAYFEAFGATKEKLFFSPHSVDDRLFDPGDARNRAAAAALRERLGLKEGTKVVLFAGKLIAAKQPRELLKAFMELEARVPPSSSWAKERKGGLSRRRPTALPPAPFIFSRSPIRRRCPRAILWPTSLSFPRRDCTRPGDSP